VSCHEPLVTTLSRRTEKFSLLCPGKLNWTPKESYCDGFRHDKEIQFKHSWRFSTIPHNLFP